MTEGRILLQYFLCLCVWRVTYSFWTLELVPAAPWNTWKSLFWPLYESNFKGFFSLHLCFYVHCTSQNLCIIMYTVGDFLHCLNLLCWCVNPCNVQDFCYLTSDSTALALKCLHLLAVFRTGWLKTAPMFASSAFTMTLLSPPGLQTTASARTSRWCVCVCVSVCLLWVEGEGGCRKSWCLQRPLRSSLMRHTTKDKLVNLYMLHHTYTFKGPGRKQGLQLENLSWQALHCRNHAVSCCTCLNNLVSGENQRVQDSVHTSRCYACIFLLRSVLLCCIALCCVLTGAHWRDGVRSSWFALLHCLVLCVDRCTLKGWSQELLICSAALSCAVCWQVHVEGTESGAPRQAEQGHGGHATHHLGRSFHGRCVSLKKKIFFNQSFHGGYSLFSFLSVILWGVSLLSFFYQTFCRGYVSLLYIHACVCVCVCACLCVRVVTLGPCMCPVLHHYFVTQSYSSNLSRRYWSCQRDIMQWTCSSFPLPPHQHPHHRQYHQHHSFSFCSSHS